MNPRTYSKDLTRNQIYHSWLVSCHKQEMTLGKITERGAKLMRRAKVHPHFHQGRSHLANALCLAFFALGLPLEYKNEKYLNRKLSSQEAEKIIALFEKRIWERIPLEYITHEAKYLGRSFYVNKNVLVPRSLMSTRFNDFLKRVQWNNHRVLDLCAGSGCIGITLALLDPNITVDLADISPQALEVAAINVKRHGLMDRLRCLQGDLFENISDKYDLIISNPPYVPEREYQPQPKEIKNEPAIALRGGEQGLDIVNRILLQAKYYLNPQGSLIIEVGYSPVRRLKKLYPHLPLQWFVSRSRWFGEGEVAEQESLLERMTNKLVGTHSILLCKAKDLPI